MSADHGKPSRRGSTLALLAALAVTLPAIGCGVKPPELSTVECRIESRPSDKAAYESLSVFSIVKDEDGLDNIVELWIVNDASALCWKLTSANWTKAVEGGDTWIGASNLAEADFSPLPRGSYRLVAIDAAGQRAEQKFEISGNFPDKEAPDLSYAGGELTIRSDWAETLALAFDGTAALIASPGAFLGKESLATAFGQDIAARTAWVGAYGYDPTLKMGAFSKRVKTR
jgi:hypothetical protein